MFGLTARRRRRLRQQPFPKEWESILRARVPAYCRLSESDRAELHGHIHVFLREKSFEGCAGLAITDEIRITIAAQACMMLLRRETDYFPRMSTVLVYPSRYFARGTQRLPNGIVVEGFQSREGESWQGAMSPLGGGPVILSWQDTRAGAANDTDGRNLVLHEFAHQLDAESGAMDGAPQLPSRESYLAWARDFTAEFNNLHSELRRAQPTLLGAYAATNPAEFFAVATELFFERPGDLLARHPSIYGHLAAYFRQDPAAAAAA